MENSSSYLYNFVCGGIAGSTAAIVSHPFLRMKIQLQNNGFINKTHYLNKKWLFTGLRYGILCYGSEKMLVFGVYNSLLNHGFDNTSAGVISGLVASFAICPGEKLVIDSMNSVSSFSRIKYIMKFRPNLTNMIIKKNIRHLYTGLSPTIFREMMGFGIHMSVFGYLMEKYNKEKSFSKTLGSVIVAIGVAWSSIVPIDRFKTAVQSPGFNFKTYSFLRSFDGFSYALLRAIPFHCTSFSLMVYLMNNKEKITKLIF